MSVIAISNPVLVSNQLGDIPGAVYSNIFNNGERGLFSFKWTFNGARATSTWGSGLTRESHEAFNQLLQQEFNGSQVAFSTYQTASFWYGGSDWVSGSGVSRLSESATKAKIKELLTSAGIRDVNTGILQYSYRTIQQIQQGVLLNPTVNTPTTAQTIANVDNTVRDAQNSFFEGLGNSLGVSVPVAIFGSALIALLILRR